MICRKERSRIDRSRIEKTKFLKDVTVMREKFTRFMQGRYGNDQFNRTLMIVVLICFLLSLFGWYPLYIIGFVIMVFAYFRMLSKNLSRRREENTYYLKYEYRIKQAFAKRKREREQRKIYHIYKCPSCRQKIRIPRGKGRIEIRCPKCRRTFIRKS